MSVLSIRGATRSCLQSARQSSLQTCQRCAISSSTRNSASLEEHAIRPRWQETPKAMAMPVRARVEPRQKAFIVNEDPEVLNQAYNKVLGNGGESMLPEEVKWLAVTHKSFDHGRRGFNDRLAFLGRRIVDLQCSLALLNAPLVYPRHPDASPHPALQGLENLSPLSKQQILDKSRLAMVASRYDLNKVIRWKPRKTDNLQSSGIDVVLAHTLYSIVGALALQRGGEAAIGIAREKILKPLGLQVL